VCLFVLMCVSRGFTSTHCYIKEGLDEMACFIAHGRECAQRRAWGWVGLSCGCPGKDELPNVRTHTPTNTNTHTHPYPHPHPHTHTLSHTHSLTHSPTHTPTHTHTHARAHTRRAWGWARRTWASSASRATTSGLRWCPGTLRWNGTWTRGGDGGCVAHQDVCVACGCVGGWRCVCVCVCVHVV